MLRAGPKQSFTRYGCFILRCDERTRLNSLRNFKIGCALRCRPPTPLCSQASATTRIRQRNAFRSRFTTGGNSVTAQLRSRCVSRPCLDPWQHPWHLPGVLLARRVGAIRPSTRRRLAVAALRSALPYPDPHFNRPDPLRSPDLGCVDHRPDAKKDSRNANHHSRNKAGDF